MIEQQPGEITVVQLQAILMPNGEVISNGKTVGWFEDLQKYLTTEKK
jgi:hypothetical protein